MIKTELSSLLKQYQINHWNYFKDTNLLIVTILAPTGNTPCSYKSYVVDNELVIISMIGTVNDSKIIDDIKDFAVKRTMMIQNPFKLIAALLKMKMSINDKEYQGSKRGVSRLCEIKNDGFIVTKSTITWPNPIYITKVSYGKYVYDVNEQVVRDMGYVINSFWLPNSKLILDVIGDGVHPHISPATNRFCIDPQIVGLSLTAQNLSILRSMLSCVSLCGMYNSELHFDNFYNLIKERVDGNAK